MIKGLTHDHENGLPNMIIKYKGKISAGYAAGEGPNNKKHPIAAGFFRVLKEVTTSKRIPNSKDLAVQKKWVLNEEIQALLEASNNKSKTPRRMKIVCLHKTPDEMWESSLAMYSSSEGLMCKSHGEGTNARFLTFTADGDREWVDRTFEGKKGCPYKKCPDFKDKKCKAIGLLKCFPAIDCSPNPYRFETRSINTIIGIESALLQFLNLLQVAHRVKQREANTELPFDGFFGATLCLTHRKVKSGGREVFITDLMPTVEFIKLVMEPIKRGLKFQVKQASIAGAGGSVSLLEEAGQKLLDAPEIEEDAVPMDIEGERDIAINFDSDADAIDGETETIHADNEPVEPSEETKQEVAEILLDKEENK